MKKAFTLMKYSIILYQMDYIKLKPMIRQKIFTNR